MMAASLGADTYPTNPTEKLDASDTMPPSSVVEKSEVTTSAPAEEVSEKRDDEDTAAGAEQQQEDTPKDTTSETPPTQSTLPTSTTQEQQQETPSGLSPPRPTAARAASEAGLGAATDLPIAAPTPSTTGGPCLSITLMLTTGARHPYKIDEKYLKNRKVEAKGNDGGFDPREITAYKLKELIWTDWRQEWEPRPASPSAIRLIILGRLMEDNSSLKGELRFAW